MNIKNYLTVLAHVSAHPKEFNSAQPHPASSSCCFLAHSVRIFGSWEGSSCGDGARHLGLPRRSELIDWLWNPARAIEDFQRVGLVLARVRLAQAAV